MNDHDPNRFYSMTNKNSWKTTSDEPMQDLQRGRRTQRVVNGNTVSLSCLINQVQDLSDDDEYYDDYPRDKDE